jgi:hypothetical protein
MPLRQTLSLAVRVVCVVIGSSGVARGDTLAPSTHSDALVRARAELSRYDLERGTTVRALERLGASIASEPDQARVLEARFLRAAVSADLIVLAHKLRRPELLAALARGLGVEPAGAIESVRAELRAVAAGHYAQVAHRALCMLDRLDPSMQGATSATELTGALGELELLERTGAAATHADAARTLAALASDPCAETSGAECSASMRTLDAQSRRALQALQNGRLAHLRLTEAARSGDPLAHACHGFEISNIKFAQFAKKKNTSLASLRESEQAQRQFVVVATLWPIQNDENKTAREERSQQIYA